MFKLINPLASDLDTIIPLNFNTGKVYQGSPLDIRSKREEFKVGTPPPVSLYYLLRVSFVAWTNRQITIVSMQCFNTLSI